MRPIRIIVAGTRTFENYELLRRTLNKRLETFDVSQVEIVSGRARGADQLGERYAREAGILVALFEADWKGLGKSAGYVRNGEMATYATHCICFWDGKSRGTKHMIDLAKGAGLKTVVINYGH